MDKYLVKRWQAVDLYSEMIAKYESLDVFDVTDIRVLDDKLNFYKSDTESQKFALKYLKPIADNEGLDNYYPNVLKEFSIAIRRNSPLILSANRLKLILKYIGFKDQDFCLEELDLNQNKKIEYLLDRFEKVVEEDDIESFGKLQGSVWFFYVIYYDNEINKSKIYKFILRLSKYKLALGYLQSPLEKKIYKFEYKLSDNDQVINIVTDTERDGNFSLIIDLGKKLPINMSGEFFSGLHVFYDVRAIFSKAVIKKIDYGEPVVSETFDLDCDTIRPIYEELVKGFY